MKISIHFKVNNKNKNFEKKCFYDHNCLRIRLIFMSEEDFYKRIQNK